MIGQLAGPIVLPGAMVRLSHKKARREWMETVTRIAVRRAPGPGLAGRSRFIVRNTRISVIDLFTPIALRALG
jgi:hypothetical protein